MDGYVTLNIKGSTGPLSDEDNRRCAEVFNTGKPVLVSAELTLLGSLITAVGYVTYGKIFGLVTASIVVYSGSTIILTLNEVESGKFVLDWKSI